VDSDAKCNPVDSIGSSTKKSGFPVRTPAFCSVSRGPSRLGEKEYRAPSMTPGVALRPRTQALPRRASLKFAQYLNNWLGVRKADKKKGRPKL
jgi:hypothetical protein